MIYQEYVKKLAEIRSLPKEERLKYFFNGLKEVHLPSNEPPTSENIINSLRSDDCVVYEDEVVHKVFPDEQFAFLSLDSNLPFDVIFSVHVDGGIDNLKITVNGKLIDEVKCSDRNILFNIPIPSHEILFHSILFNFKTEGKITAIKGVLSYEMRRLLIDILDFPKGTRYNNKIYGKFNFNDLYLS